MPRRKRKIHSSSSKYPLYKRHNVKGKKVKLKIREWAKRKGYSKAKIERIVGGSIKRTRMYKHKKHKSKKR